jgi:hypothetical protein
MISEQIVSQFSWLTQGHTLVTDVRVLQLQCYDMVLAMDWLENHSPMWVPWKRKILMFTHKKTIFLHRVKPKIKSCLNISGKKLKGMLRKGGVAQILQLSHVLTPSKEDTVPTSFQTLVRVINHCSKNLNSYHQKELWTIIFH